MRNLRTVFFGSSEFSVGVLDALAMHGITPVLIVTTPAKPKGRGLVLTPTPVAEWAEKNGIDAIAPARLDADIVDEIKNTDWDVFLVASYGKIIPQAVLDIPKKGTLNVHPSLLPKFRGASPIRSAILADEQKTGVSIMLVDADVDHGPIVAQASVEIQDLPAQAGWPLASRVLSALLAKEGGGLLAEALPLWMKGDITPEPQEHDSATFTKKFDKEDALIDLADNAHANLLKIRAFDDDPVAYFLTKRNGRDIRVKVTSAREEDGKLVIERVIPEGKKEMGYEDFLRGNR